MGALRVLLVPGRSNPPAFDYLNSVIIYIFPFTGAICTNGLADFAAMTALSSLRTARESVTWPTRFNDPSFPSHPLYPVGRMFPKSKTLMKTVSDQLDVEKLNRDAPYSVEDLTANLDAGENQLSMAGQAWVVWNYKELRVATTGEQSCPGLPIETMGGMRVLLCPKRLQNPPQCL